MSRFKIKLVDREGKTIKSTDGQGKSDVILEVTTSTPFALIKKMLHIKTDVSCQRQQLYFENQELHDSDTFAILEGCDGWNTQNVKIVAHFQKQEEQEQKIEKSYEELLAELAELESEGQRLASQNANLFVEYGNAHGLADFFASQVQVFVNAYEKQSEAHAPLKNDLHSVIENNAQLEREMESIQLKTEKFDADNAEDKKVEVVSDDAAHSCMMCERPYAYKHFQR